MTAEGLWTPLCCWSSLHVWMWAVLVLVSNGDVEGADPQCEIELIVRRHTIYEASVGQNLRINCTLAFCQDPPPPVYWYKGENNAVQLNVSRSSHMETEWRTEEPLEGVSVLVFHGVLRSDSGLYQCRTGEKQELVGHYINVSVSGLEVVPSVTSQTETNHTSTSAADRNWDGNSFWTYIYCAAGITGMVLIVIVTSVLSMRGCKGKPQTENQTENQYMVIPMVEQPYPRGSPSSPPSGPTPRTKTPPPPTQRQNEHVYGKAENDRERHRGRTEEGAGSVLYAALNHQAGAGLGPGPRPRREAEEMSEYASIRVS